MLHGLVTIIGTSISDDKHSNLLSGKSFRCVCGNCQPMATSRELLCCQEVEQMVALLDGDSPPSFAECPGLSALPSPPIASGESRDTHSAKRFSCSFFHTDITAGSRYSVWWI